MFETWYQVENFLLSGRLKLEPIVTHHLPLAEFERGFKLMQAGEAIKVVLEIPHERSLPYAQRPTSTSVLATCSKRCADSRQLKRSIRYRAARCDGARRGQSAK